MDTSRGSRWIVCLPAAVVIAALAASGCGSERKKPLAAENASAAPAAAEAATIGAKNIDSLGTVLAGVQNRTLYVFTGDKLGQSKCVDACASSWPPMITAGQPRSSGGAKQSSLDIAQREDGSQQVTYAGHPLYLFAQDQAKDDHYGQGVSAFGGEWYVISPSGKLVKR